MKLGVKIALIVISLFLTAVVIAVCVCSSIANRISDTSLPTAEASSWQSMIKDETLLKRVVIPGAHDAGTVGMAWFSETQSRDIADQLACGTRYFDLRIKVKKGEARIYHGPAVSLYLKDILTQVRDFLTENPSEVVILDFQKFAKDDAKDETLALMAEYLDGMCVVNDTEMSDVDFIDTLTIGNARGKCLIFWGAEDGVAEKEDNVFLRNDDNGNRYGSALHSYYKRGWNSYYSSEKYIEKALPAYIDKYKAIDSGLFVLQGQLTDGSFVAGPRYREGCHEKNMNEYVRSLAENVNLEYVNIVMRDYISPDKNCITLRLNLAKGIVKDECVEAFEFMLDTRVKVIA